MKCSDEGVGKRKMKGIKKQESTKVVEGEFDWLWKAVAELLKCTKRSVGAIREQGGYHLCHHSYHLGPSCFSSVFYQLQTVCKAVESRPWVQQREACKVPGSEMFECKILKEKQSLSMNFGDGKKSETISVSACWLFQQAFKVVLRLLQCSARTCNLYVCS